ncbi:MAG: LL-diaminopimelate aminotransferase [Clostridiales bacterium]|jgi:LL-diaminopimelate aminotransferase|nr:LL-diaminopimelate aminotransferase [Clostridiales bacterium]
MKINKNYAKMKDGYLFAEVAKRTAEYQKANPDKKIIRLGIGDVTIPLCKAAVEAGVSAVREQGEADTFRGYGPYRGYEFLTNAVVDYYKKRGVTIDESEVFVSEGAKNDVANILDIFDAGNTALIPDPVYPVYYDTNVMNGAKIKLIDANKSNGFLPLPHKKLKADIIYLCSPNNPTGAVYNKEQLKAWVDFVRGAGAVILFDAAYEFYVRDPSLPRSIYEVDGAKECAIEFCSLSKTAGFTGVRCGYTVVPRSLYNLNALWLRRQSTKFNGASYIVQRMAAAVFGPEGQKQIADNIGVYMKNAALISETLSDLGIFHTGGANSPYIWLECPGQKSWDFFDLLLSRANVVGTPGAGFGKCGEGFFRLTAFNNFAETKQATERIKAVLG